MTTPYKAQRGVMLLVWPPSLPAAVTCAPPAQPAQQTPAGPVY